MPMNYLTAQFALETARRSSASGETVLVNGAAGGVGTACLQVAKGYGARTIAVVSTEEKADFVRALGADEAVLSTASSPRSRSSPTGRASTSWSTWSAAT